MDLTQLTHEEKAKLLQELKQDQQQAKGKDRSDKEQIVQTMWAHAGQGIEHYLSAIGSFNHTTTINGVKVSIVIKQLTVKQ